MSRSESNVEATDCLPGEDEVANIGTKVTALLVDIDEAEVIKLKSSADVEADLRVQFTTIPARTLKRLLSSLADTIKSNALRIAEENNMMRKEHKERMLAEYHNDRRLLLIEKRMDALTRAQKRAKFTAHRQYRNIGGLHGNNAEALATEVLAQKVFGGSSDVEELWRHHNHQPSLSPTVVSAMDILLNDPDVAPTVKTFVKALMSSASGSKDIDNNGVSHSVFNSGDEHAADDNASINAEGDNEDANDDWTEFKEVHYRLDKLEERQDKMKPLSRWCKMLDRAVQTLEERVANLDNKFEHLLEEQRRMSHSVNTFRHLFESHESHNIEDFKAVREDALDIRDQVESVRRGLHNKVPLHDMPKKADTSDLDKIRHEVTEVRRAFEDSLEALTASTTFDMDVLRSTIQTCSKSLDAHQSEVRLNTAQASPCGWCTSCGMRNKTPQFSESVPHVRLPVESNVRMHRRLPKSPNSQQKVGNTGNRNMNLDEKCTSKLNVWKLLSSPLPARNSSTFDARSPRQLREGTETLGTVSATVGEGKWEVSNVGIAFPSPIAPPAFERLHEEKHHRASPNKRVRHRGSAWSGNRSWETGSNNYRLHD